MKPKYQPWYRFKNIIVGLKVCLSYNKNVTRIYLIKTKFVSILVLNIDAYSQILYPVLIKSIEDFRYTYRYSMKIIATMENRLMYEHFR